MKFRFLTAAFLAVILIASFVPQAHASIWTGAYCGASAPIGTDAGPTGSCGFCDAIIVGRNVINFLVEMSVLLAVLMIVWHSMRLVAAGGNPSTMEDAKMGMWRGIKGMIIVASAWILMNALLIFIARGTASGSTSQWKWNEIQCSQ